MRVNSGIVPATAVVPIQTAPIAIDGANRWIIRTVCGGCTGSTAKRKIRSWGWSHIAPRFNFCDAAVGIRRTTREHTDLSGGNRGEVELPPHLVVAAHTTPRYSDPCTAVPVLNGISSQAIQRKRHRFSRLSGCGRVVLKRDDVDFIDSLAAVETDLKPIGMRVDSGIVPPTAVVPIQTAPVAIDSAARWIVSTVLRGTAAVAPFAASATLIRSEHVNPSAEPTNKHGTRKRKNLEK